MWRIPNWDFEQLESVPRHRCALASTVISRQEGCKCDFDVESLYTNTQLGGLEATEHFLDHGTECH